MPINLPLFKAICETPGVSGFEKKIRQLIIQEVTPIVDDVFTDNMGNVFAHKKGRSDKKKVMLAAHMDEIGFIVKHIDENGFLRFHTLGGFDPKTLTAQRVLIHGRRDLIGVMGSKPIHIMNAEERTKLPKIDDYFIDLGLPYAEVIKTVRVGDPITRERDLIEIGDCLNGKSIDNRVSVYVLIETLRLLENPEYDVYGVFTVQEEVGTRGVNVAAHRINPDFGIAIDTTIAYDLPGSKPEEQITCLGKGVAIKIMDSSAICDYRMVDFLKQTAEKNMIPWQPEVLTAGGTDTSGLQRMGKNGSIAGAVSIPTRHLHQVIEMAHKQDITHTIQLLKNALESIEHYNWAHE